MATRLNSGEINDSSKYLGLSQVTSMEEIRQKGALIPELRYPSTASPCKEE